MQRTFSVKTMKIEIQDDVTHTCLHKNISYEVLHQSTGFHYSALKVWNDIPAELRELPTPNSFKKQLKTYLKG